VVEKDRRTRVWVATDGELSRERSPIAYETLPHAAMMLRPAAHGEGEKAAAP
jgi:hypothetical protein